MIWLQICFVLLVCCWFDFACSSVTFCRRCWLCSCCRAAQGSCHDDGRSERRFPPTGSEKGGWRSRKAASSSSRSHAHHDTRTRRWVLQRIVLCCCCYCCCSTSLSLCFPLAPFVGFVCFWLNLIFLVDDGITKATRAMGAADPVNKSFSERMNLFKKVEAVDQLQDEGEEEGAEY